MERSIAEFSVRVTNEAKTGNLNVALAKIVEFVRQIIFRQSSLGKVFSSPHLDRLCALIGTMAREGAGPVCIPAGDAREDPFGGGRVVVEAMEAGLPLVIHSNYRSRFFTHLEAYGATATWRYPQELGDRISSLDRPELIRHARRSRSYYEAHHRPELLRAAIDVEVSGGEPPRPTRPMHVTDRLQAYLDDYHAFWTRSGRKIVLTDEERDAVDEKWRREVERVRAETIRSMTIPARTRRVLARMLAKRKSLFTRTRSG